MFGRQMRNVQTSLRNTGHHHQTIHHIFHTRPLRKRQDKGTGLIESHQPLPLGQATAAAAAADAPSRLGPEQEPIAVAVVAIAGSISIPPQLILSRDV
eukprot:CAMPEP_0198294498 /NCGR_PEP_ID=MMETSP1449-20131203/22648_1 /TAXON_ID=420275 /ORGANISM="Attheya septentrionalis, Strain CCMP2084" /LENGTH=97 /DNA_ID=CAMNT_0043994461 /DNA_START=31 /DNA_END=321 /DNA_ORIENTATION=-